MTTLRQPQADVDWDCQACSENNKILENVLKKAISYHHETSMPTVAHLDGDGRVVLDQLREAVGAQPAALHQLGVCFQLAQHLHRGVLLNQTLILR